jgi:uncharacterized NAD(P)/FAD-binding protein YdhS
VVGAGFSGVMAALHILRRPDAPGVMLFDRRTPFARGAAYSSANPDHVLNVRAGNMSAWPDDPGHFVQWLSEARQEPPRDDMFATRGDYGRYLQGLLAREAECASAAGRLVVVPDEVVDAVRDGDGWRIELGVGRCWRVNALVLALGNPPPVTPTCVAPELATSGLYVADPWSWQGVAADTPSDDPVLLIGTGLTMVDVALACHRTEPDRPLVALSRHGLRPKAHEGPPPQDLPVPPAGQSPSALAGWLRRTAREIGWRAAVDSLRPATQAIWGHWSLAERSRFLRHARPYWDVHRHRLAPRIAARIEALVASGQLSIRPGRLQALERSGDRVTAQWAPRGQRTVQRQDFARVINCTGPAADITTLRDPLLVRLRDQGHVRADALRLGLDALADGRLVGREGAATPGLFGLGPIVRGALWEVVAVPDIRMQAPVLAQRVARTVAEASAVGRVGLDA